MAEPFSVTSALGLTGFSLGGISLWASIFLLLGIVFCIFIMGGGIIVLVIWNKSYNQRVHLWAKVNGVPQKLVVYKAKWLKIAGKQSNERLMFVRSIGRWENPRIMSGKNEWHYWKREQDGEWINFGFEDLDETQRKMKIKFIDGDVRSQRVANEKVLRDRFAKKKNWMEIIAQIGYIIVFIFLIIGLVVLFTQLKDLSKSMVESAQAIGKLADAVSRERGLSPDSQPTGNSGLVPAEATT